MVSHIVSQENKVVIDVTLCGMNAMASQLSLSAAWDWSRKLTEKNLDNNNIGLAVFFPGQPDKPAPWGKTILDFSKARDVGVAVALAGPYANHLHLVAAR